MRRSFYAFFASVFVGILLILVFVIHKKTALFSEPNKKHDVVRYEKGYRFDQNGWIYVHIEGKPYERGFQHGRLLAPEIQKILKNTKELVYLNTGMTWQFFVSAAERLFVWHLDKEFLEEMQGIADGASSPDNVITRQDILVWNAYIELLYYWWPTKGKKAVTGDGDKDHCSAFIATGAATKDGSVVMAHNTWTPFELGQNFNLILDLKPERGFRIFMQSAPGCISSVTDFFLTSAGIIGTETTIGDFNVYNEKGSPTFLRIRRAMQYAHNLDEVVAIMLKANSGGYANTWLLADITTHEIMQFELGLKYYHVERKKDGYFIGVNLALDPRIRNLECSEKTGFANIKDSEGARYVRLTQLMGKYYGKLDTKIAQNILADHYDVYLNKENPCTRTIEAHYELDDCRYTDRKPFKPQGAVDGKVVDSGMAKKMSFFARWGNSSGMPFNAKKFIAQHIQWNYLAPYLENRPTQPWTLFTASTI